MKRFLGLERDDFDQVLFEFLVAGVKNHRTQVALQVVRYFFIKVEHLQESLITVLERIIEEQVVLYQMNTVHLN